MEVGFIVVSVFFVSVRILFSIIMIFFVFDVKVGIKKLA